MTSNRYYIRQLIGRALGAGRTNPQLWGLIIKECGGATELRKKLEQEKVSFLALPGLKRNSDIPDDIVKHLEITKLRCLANNLYLLKVFEEISNLFVGEDIAHTPIKGVDLIRDFYDDPALRPISDIDILVHPARFGDAVETLCDRGFQKVRTAQRLPGVWPAINFIKDAGSKPIWIDLHYCPGPAVGNRVKNTIAMFRNISALEPLPPEYRTVILAAHHQNHFMKMPLIAYYELLHLFSVSNRRQLLKLASKWQVVDALSTALNQAAYIFGVSTLRCKSTKNDILKTFVARGMRDPRGGSSGFESLVYLLSLDNPGTGIPFGLNLLYKKITSSL